MAGHTGFHRAAWDWITDKISTVLDGIKNFVTDRWNALRDTTVNVYNAVKEAIGAAWDWIKEKVETAARSVIDFVKQRWDDFKRGTEIAYDAVKEKISSTWNTIKTAVETAANAVKDAVARAWDEAKRKTNEVWDAVKDAVSGAWDSIKSAVSGKIGEVVGAVRELPGKITGALGGLGSLLYNAGLDLIQGLANGIRDAAGRAVGAAKGVVSDAVSGAKRLLGISSPSKVFMGIGQDVGAGLVIGLDKSTKSVRTAAESLANTTIGQIGRLNLATPNISAAAGGSSVPVTSGDMNIHNELTVNAADVPADQVAREGFYQLREMERAQRYR